MLDPGGEQKHNIIASLQQQKQLQSLAVVPIKTEGGKGGAPCSNLSKTLIGLRHLLKLRPAPCSGKRFCGVGELWNMRVSIAREKLYCFRVMAVLGLFKLLSIVEDVD